MAKSLNRVTLVGNLGRDPEVTTMPNGSKVAKLRVATSEEWKDRNTGEKREAVEWHSITIFGDGLIDGVVAPFLRKGSRLLIEGMLKTRKWQAVDGSDRYSTEIHLSPFRGQLILMDRRDGSSGGYGSPPADPGGSGRSDIDDEIPF